MVYKKSLSLVLTIFVMLTMSMVSMNPSSASGQNFVLQEEKPTISTVGSAEKEIPSDESRISLAVENTDANANTARKNNADNMNTIIDVLKQAGLTEDNITTSNFQISPNYDYENSNYDKIISYTALNKIELKTSANANISQFIDLAVSNGANRVENIDFVISEGTLDRNNLELLKEAFGDAKQKAQTLATEGNFTITGVKKIDASTGGGYSPPSPFLYESYGADAKESVQPPSTQIIPQKSKVSVSLPVIFYIGERNSIE
jgi:hypothetical protein